MQINSVKGNEKRLIKVFGLEFVKELIERMSDGKPIKELFQKGEDKIACKVLKKIFAKEATLRTHIKNHYMCHKCDQGFMKETELKGHIQLVHGSLSIYENTVNEINSNNCEDCGHISKTRKSLMIHKDKEHIEDSWLVGTKREQNMMTSKQELRATKTEEPCQK